MAKRKKRENDNLFSPYDSWKKCWRGVKQHSLTDSFARHKLELKQMEMWSVKITMQRRKQDRDIKIKWRIHSGFEVLCYSLILSGHIKGRDSWLHRHSDKPNAMQFVSSDSPSCLHTDCGFSKSGQYKPSSVLSTIKAALIIFVSTNGSFVFCMLVTCH
jgi:hypothetical protein